MSAKVKGETALAGALEGRGTLIGFLGTTGGRNESIQVGHSHDLSKVECLAPGEHVEVRAA